MPDVVRQPRGGRPDAGRDCILLVHSDDGHSLSPAAAAASLDAELELYRSAFAL